MSTTEITQAQWTALGFPNPSAEPVGDDYPVGFVNFFEAAAWCNRLSELEGLDECYDLSKCTGEVGSGCPDGDYYQWGCAEAEGSDDVLPDLFDCLENIHRYADYYECPGYRLPTGAEWEYAAKAGTTTHTYNGDVLDDMAAGYCLDQPTLNPIAWYCHNTGGSESGHPMKVGQKQPNPWGFLDILGNMHEWTDYVLDGASIDVADGHPGEPLVDPIGKTPETYGIGDRHDAKGAGLRDTGCYVRPANNLEPRPRARGLDCSFRPVRTLLDVPPLDAGVPPDGGK